MNQSAHNTRFKRHDSRVSAESAGGLTHFKGSKSVGRKTNARNKEAFLAIMLIPKMSY
jgi:hypothetical protein